MTDGPRQQRTTKKPELTEADKAPLEAEPDWERMGQAAKRLLRDAPERDNNVRSQGAQKRTER